MRTRFDLRAKASPQPMSNDTRQRLWWKAQRISFAWWAWRNEGDKPPLMTRQEWARLVYRIFSQYPEEALKNE